MRIRFSLYALAVLIFLGSVGGAYYLFLNYKLNLYNLLLFNLGYAVFFSFIWHYVFIDKVTRFKLYLFSFSIVLCASLPLVGNALFIILTPFLARIKKVSKAIRIHEVEYPTFKYETEIKTDISIGSLSGAKIHLNDEKALTAQKMRALTMLNVTFTPSNIDINQKAIRYKNDEVRLYAFSMLNTRQRQIERRIGVMLKQLKVIKEDNRKALTEKGLASLYWELIYYRFISRDLLDFTIKKALQYALSATKILSSDPNLWMLIGRLYTKQNKFDEGVEALNKAIELKAPIYRIAPFLAEIYFKKKDYARVRKYLHYDDSLKLLMNINGIIRFWTLKKSENKVAT